MIFPLELSSVFYPVLEWSGVIIATVGIYMTWQVRKGQIRLEAISEERLGVALSVPVERWWKTCIKSLCYILIVVGCGPVTWFFSARAFLSQDPYRGSIGMAASFFLLGLTNFWFLKTLTEFSWARRLSNFYATRFRTAGSTGHTLDTLAYVLAYLGVLIEIVLKIFPVPQTPEQFPTNVGGAVVWGIVVGLMIFLSPEPTDITSNP